MLYVYDLVVRQGRMFIFLHYIIRYSYYKHTHNNNSRNVLVKEIKLFSSIRHNCLHEDQNRCDQAISMNPRDYAIL